MIKSILIIIMLITSCITKEETKPTPWLGTWKASITKYYPDLFDYVTIEARITHFENKTYTASVRVIFQGQSETLSTESGTWSNMDVGSLQYFPTNCTENGKAIVCISSYSKTVNISNGIWTIITPEGELLNFVRVYP